MMSGIRDPDAFAVSPYSNNALISTPSATIAENMTSKANPHSNPLRCLHQVHRTTNIPITIHWL